jgi:hypothetical protein
MIEPSVTYGNLYLDLTREFSLAFKAVSPPSPEEKVAMAAPAPRPPADTAPLQEQASQPTPGPSPTPTATPISFAAYRTTNNLRVRSGPGTTYNVLDQVPPDFVLDILGRSADNLWLAIAYPDLGSLGWVSAEFVTPGDGFEQFPIELGPGQADADPSSTRPPSFLGSDELPSWY